MNQSVAQLGQTSDPQQLIPGSPEAVRNTAQTLIEKGNRLEEVGDSLGRVEIPDWSGQASNAFWDKFTAEKPNWFRGADAMNAAAEALSAHADSLGWAQDQAAEAIELWEQGESATEKARAEHAEAVASVEAWNASNSGGPSAPAIPMPTFTDPGEALREQARQILEEARRQLREAGDTAAETLRRQAGQDDDSPGWLSKVSDVAITAIKDLGTGKTNIKLFTGGSGPVSNDMLRSWGAHDPNSSNTGSGIDWKVQLGKVSGEAYLWGVGAEGKTQLGDITLAGSAGLQTLGVQGSTGLSIDGSGLTGELKGRAYLAQASAEGSAEYGILGVRGEAEGFVGAEAGVEASVGPDGVHLGAEAFAGAKVTGSAHADVGGIGAGVNAEGWAGAGIAADATIGMQDGKFTVGGEFGVGLGLGGKVSGDIVIDPGEVADTVGKVADTVNDATSWATDAAASTASTLTDTAKSTWDNLVGR